MKELAAKFQIKQEFSSPYQHQSNGLAEKSLRTVMDMVQWKEIFLKKTWISLLPRIRFSINATKQNSTGASTLEIIFGRKLQLHGLQQPNSGN